MGGYRLEGHNERYRAEDPGGSYRVSGRFNRGRDRFPDDEVIPALYLGLDRAGTLGKVLRHLGKGRALKDLKGFVLSKLRVDLSRSVDCRDLADLGISEDDLLHPNDYQVGQGLAAAAVASGAEGMLVPSATRLGDNLIVFPDNLSAGSTVELLSSESLRYVSPPG